MRKSFKSIMVTLILAVCYSPITSATEEEDFLINQIGKCIASYESMVNIMEQITKRDIEIMRIYSHVEVAERKISRWTIIGENPDMEAKLKTIKDDRNVNIDKIIGILYNRDLKATRLRNLRIQLSKCNLSEMPNSSLKNACKNTQIKDTPQCKMLVR